MVDPMRETFRARQPTSSSAKNKYPCDLCMRYRRRCDGMAPSKPCSLCAKRNHDCTYSKYCKDIGSELKIRYYDPSLHGENLSTYTPNFLSQRYPCVDQGAIPHINKPENPGFPSCFEVRLSASDAQNAYDGNTIPSTDIYGAPDAFDFIQMDEKSFGVLPDACENSLNFYSSHQIDEGLCLTDNSEHSDDIYPLLPPPSEPPSCRPEPKSVYVCSSWKCCTRLMALIGLLAALGKGKQSTVL
ncbi:hypothetical protein SCHPADRAFT_661816 [Schizopora paradoxa]|uniref:Zn(2)-C6 fungal-type domain-containing protein n=1 Tax=Schizopora paradoxa TaxID=27342 RepID=A0A0H2RCE4_9AGAM|nr:hypothetical protein SCHPADRAFT_661816 [Schizopora paradoxa]